MKVFAVMKNVTDLLRQTFPGVKIYPTVGNHDVWPAHQVPGEGGQYYSNILTLAGFDQLLGDAEMGTFKKGTYFVLLSSVASETGRIT
jgi:hypothetical protein